MEAAQHIVKLGPIAVELIDRTMLGLAREIAMFQPTIDAVVRGDPEAILFVEFAEDDQDENFRRLVRLSELIGDLGLAWDKTGAQWGGVIEVLDPKLQTAITEVRTAGLNIMMSMKEEGKPVSFVEDCAVPLEHLADYTARLTEIFEKHGTRGTWYAHASVGCLHVRPVLNLRLDKDVKAMRAIAEEAFAMVRDYKGSHSGEHGDGIVRSEFHELMFGARLVRAFEEVKDRFDPNGLLQSRQDRARAEVRRPQAVPLRAGLPRRRDRRRSSTGRPIRAPAAVSRARSRCATTTAPAARSPAASCARAIASPATSATSRAGAPTRCGSPSPASSGPTRSPRTRWRETLKLCVSCKACRRECPTGVDMARMKIEVQAARVAKHGLSLHDRLVGYLPRYAPYAARWPGLANLRDDMPRLQAMVGEDMPGFSARRSLPRWRSDVWREPARRPRRRRMARGGRAASPTPSTAISSRRTSRPRSACSPPPATRVHLPKPADGARRPLCCGRTFLAVGLVDEARPRGASAASPRLRRSSTRGIAGRRAGAELHARLPRRDCRRCSRATRRGGSPRTRCCSRNSWRARRTRARSTCRSSRWPSARCCTAIATRNPSAPWARSRRRSQLVPDLAVETVESSCCGMAGAFGYGADTIDVSLKMAELSLLPAVRKAAPDTLVVADGTSCRHQIKDGSGREALHVARVLAMSLNLPAAGAGTPADTAPDLALT